MYTVSTVYVAHSVAMFFPLHIVAFGGLLKTASCWRYAGFRYAIFKST